MKESNSDSFASRLAARAALGSRDSVRGKDEGGPSSSSVDLARVFWADQAKVEIYSVATSRAADEARLFAATQEWVIRRDVLLKNVLALAAAESVLEADLVRGILADADASDTPLFRFVPLDVLSRVSKGLVATADDGASGADESSMDTSREALVSSILSWALASEKVVQPQEFDDMQFSWTFKDQPYIARRAAWRTVVSVGSSASARAREEIGGSLALDSFPGAPPCDRIDPFCGTAMTTAAFDICLEDATRVVLEVDTSSPDQRAVEIAPGHLGLLKTALLEFFKTGAAPAAGTEISVGETDSLSVTLGPTGPSLETDEIEIRFAPGSAEVEAQTLVASPSDLRCLVDLLDFVALHPKTLPHMRVSAPLGGSTISGPSFDLNEGEIYEGTVRWRLFRSAAKVAASVVIALGLAWAGLNRKSPQVQGIHHSSQAFARTWAERYEGEVQRRQLTGLRETEVPGSSLKENRAATRALAEVLKTSAEKMAPSLTTDGQARARRASAGGAKLRYQVVMARSGEVIGLSPANVPGIRRWRDVSAALGFKPTRSTAKASARSSSSGGGAGDRFVFLLTLGEGGGAVAVEPWDTDYELTKD